MFQKLLDFLFRRQAQDTVLDARFQALSHKDVPCAGPRAVPMFGHKAETPRPKKRPSDQP